ncbi:hypothetical protein AEA09_09540 [Lysinibacillus contaminans]|uniref:Uncharacterized protein n=1 Tax=Lysinibacillus contaminans TaxID=1293441 RepID=A0ABR5K1N3_9BACI|nr:hypothetical protein AEA09_09540 [Lysinibacillus contaminans]
MKNFKMLVKIVLFLVGGKELLIANIFIQSKRNCTEKLDQSYLFKMFKNGYLRRKMRIRRGNKKYNNIWK